MRRPRTLVQRVALCLLATLTLGVGPTLAQVTRGVFEGPPGGSNTATGAVALTGWVLADVGVRRVIIQVDGVDIGEANYGRPRGAVAALHPGFPDSNAAGFGYYLNATDFLNGPHTVTAKAELNDGSFFTLEPARTLQFSNATHNLRPFGEIERPEPTADLVGSCDPDDPFRTYAVVNGWALDLGVEIGDSGVGYVQVMIDGVVLYDTRRDCHFDLLTGGPTQCYGLTRLDIERRYPYAFDAPSAGFRFVLDVGALILSGRAEGHHDLTVKVGDISNQIENIDEMPVNFWCSQNQPNGDAFGQILSPRPNRLWTGLMRFEGWALDPEGVAKVELWVDGQFVRLAPFGVDSRDDVAMSYPGFPDSLAPVWRAFFDSNEFVDGMREVEVFVIDFEGARTSIGSSSFLVDNDF